MRHTPKTIPIQNTHQLFLDFNVQKIYIFGWEKEIFWSVQRKEKFALKGKWNMVVYHNQACSTISTAFLLNFRHRWGILHHVTAHKKWIQLLQNCACTSIFELLHSANGTRVGTQISMLPISAAHVGEPGPGEITILSNAFSTYK